MHPPPQTDRHIHQRRCEQLVVASVRPQIQTSKPSRVLGLFGLDWIQLPSLRHCNMGEEAANVPQLPPHIVLFAFPIQGRLIPAMMFASRLTKVGAKVSFICPHEMLSLLSEARARGYDDRVQLVGLKVEGFHKGATIMIMFEKYPKLVEAFEAYINSLPQKPACVITGECDSFPVTMGRLGIPRYLLVPQSALALSATMLVRKLAAEGRIPLSSHELVEIPGIQPRLHSSECLSVYHQDAPEWLKNFFVRTAPHAHDARGAFINTFEELEPGALQALREENGLNPNKLQIIPVGPLLPTHEDPTDNLHSEQRSSAQGSPCLEFLDQHPPASVVYISFGSLRMLNENEVHEIAFGLEAAGFPFIWVLRCEPAFIPEGFQLRTQGLGLIMWTWAPQLKILSHPSTALFVTHFGWNSTLESISCGVPMLGLPGFLDQYMNCRLVKEVLKVGLRLNLCSDGLIHRSEVEKGVREVMGSQKMRQRGRLLRDAARAAMEIADQKLASFIAGL